MNYDQIKEIVDLVSQGQNRIMLRYFLAYVVALFFANWLLSYLSQKGKNLATKEDITAITEAQEEITAVFAERMKRLENQLAERSHYNKFRYEREMDVFQELWPKLWRLYNAASNLRPAKIAADPQEEVRLQKGREAKFLDAIGNLSVCAQDHKPFFADTVWAHLDALNVLLMTKATLYESGSTFETADVKSRVDEICKAIRSRLKEFDGI